MAQVEQQNDPSALMGKIGRKAKAAAPVLLSLSPDQINQLLNDIAKAIRKNSAAIQQANKEDMNAGNSRGLNDAMLDRLMLNNMRIESIASSVENVAKLPDYLNKTLWEQERPNGLKIKRVSVPIGTLGMIYESRPNVTADAAALCLKSRNAIILRGGSESLHSSLAIHKIIEDVLEQNNIPKHAVSMIQTSDRKMVGAMLQAHNYIDVMIPRGGKNLIERVMNEAMMPVFSHLEGLCHIYVDNSVNPDIAKTVPLNAKMRRTGICGAMETLLLDDALDKSLATKIIQTLLNANCTLIGDEKAQSLNSHITAATEADWKTEYLEAKLSIKFVKGVDEAITHINHFGSHHTESILAEDQSTVEKFQQQIDSGIVMHNTSTQFADGGEFGMGAEIGIATGKMHARGPVGVEQLMTYKYLVTGTGQTRP